MVNSNKESKYNLIDPSFFANYQLHGGKLNLLTNNTKLSRPMSKYLENETIVKSHTIDLH